MSKEKKQQDKPQQKDDKKVEELEKKTAELTEALQRERADSINLRRRMEEDRNKLADLHKASVVRELLKHAPKDLAEHDYVKGVQGVVKQFDKVLDELGVKKIKTVGEEFNPKYHEAVSVEDDGGELEIVCEELQSGYQLGDEIIRHAMVKVKMEKKND
jgi:molecular chaperone GrpE